MMKISIGITAYNEEQNIRDILRNFVSQNQDNIEIAQIVLISDGSTDATVARASEIKDSRIFLINEKERLGKPVRINQLLKLCKGDYIFLTDADILINDRKLIENMVKKFGTNTALVCGYHLPLEPKTYAEKVFFEGLKSWNRSMEILGDKAELYYCTGHIMCLSKTFSGSLQLPDDIYAGIDQYIFFFAKQNKFEVKIAKNCLVYYKLPDSFRDYLRQMTRYMAIPRLMHHYFGEKLIEQFDAMTGEARVEGIIKTLRFGNFYLMLNYIGLQVISILRSRFYSRDAKWKIALSSKELVN